MAEDKNDPSGFKVVDRRSFSVDGTRLEGGREDEKKPEPRPTVPRASVIESEAQPDEYFEEGPARFDTLVSYLSTTALFQLGLLPGPGGERIPADLGNAQRTIDMLEVLQRKTRGNLTPDETKLLEDVLYELRVSFVEVQKPHAKKRK
jgi:hypothetical protein